MTQKEMGELMLIMSGIWSNFAADDISKIKTWHMIIGDIDFRLAKATIMKLANTNKFAPSPAEIRDVVLEITTPSENCKTAEEAWIEVQKVVRANSWNYGSEKCKEEIKNLGIRTEKAVEYLGYNQLWNCDTYRDMPFIEKRFKNFYDEMAERELRQNKLPLGLKETILRIAGDLDMQEKLC